MSMGQAIIFFFLLSLFACAWNPKEIQETEIETDLAQTFNESEDEEILKKFVVKEEIPPPEPGPGKERNGGAGPSQAQAPKPVLKPSSAKKESVKNRTASKSLPQYPESVREQYRQYDAKAAPVWRVYRPRIFPGEQMFIDIKYFGVTAGKVVINTLPAKEVNDKKAYHFLARLKSAPFYSYIYELDDYVEVYVESENFFPIKYSLIQRETKQEVDDLQVFDRQQLETHLWYKKIKEGETKKERKTAPMPFYSLDSFSSIFFVRGLPLKVGEKYQFPIMTRAKLWLLTFEVERRERITIGDQVYPALRIQAETQFPGVLKKSGDILFWFSDDEQRKLLKFEAKVKIGTVTGELSDYQN